MKSGVLFVSPNLEDALILVGLLSPLSISFEHVEGLEQARAKLRADPCGVILTEATLADGDWLDLLHLARELAPDAQVIVTHPLADARFWAEALNRGAWDLIAQPFAAGEVQRILSNACSRILHQQTARAVL